MSSISSRKDTIGWVGVGRMGEAMVRRLLQHYEVLLWNRTRPKAEHLVPLGARLVDSKADLAGVDILFVMVSTGADVKSVLFCDGGVLTCGDKVPGLVVDCSSISEAESAEIRALLAAKGVAFLAAPVSGNAKVIDAGKLSVVVSGPRDGFERAQPYLETLGYRVTYVGQEEQARAWKICHNTFLGIVTQSLCEVTVLAERAGMPRHVFLEALNASVMGSVFTRYKSPVMVNLDFDHVTFTPPLLLKDMDLGIAAAKAHGVTMPVAASCREALAAVAGRHRDSPDVDFAVALMEVAASSGLKLEPEDKHVESGL